MNRATASLIAALAAAALAPLSACNEQTPSSGTAANTTTSTSPAASSAAATPSASSSAQPAASETPSATPAASASGTPSAAPSASDTKAAAPAPDAAPEDSAEPASKYNCGGKGQKPCPMQGWMRGVMGRAMQDGDKDKIAQALNTIAAKVPPGDYGQWAGIASAGAAKAAAGDIDGAKGSCKQCHSLYQKKYKDTQRDQPW